MTEDVENPHYDDVTDDPVVSDYDAEDELVPGPETEQSHCRPILTRRPPTVLCYNQLVNPSYHPCSASNIQISTEIVPGQPMYCSPCPPWVITATAYYYGSPSLH